jgi:hypothetical protein
MKWAMMILLGIMFVMVYAAVLAMIDDDGMR